MDPQIHGALVGGAVGGATVVLGVTLTEWLTRARDRRRAVEDASHRLGTVVPHVVVAFTEAGAGIDRNSGSTWQLYLEETIGLIAVLRRNARWPMRRRRSIRAAAEHLGARIAGAHFACDYDGVVLDPAHLPALTTTDVAQAVFGRVNNLDALAKHYREHGPASSP